MGREIRNVPANWTHPKDGRGHYRPLYDEDYETALNQWWEKRLEDPDQGLYEDSYGNAPQPESYRPAFDKPADHFQIYETVTKGTPVSPVFATKKELIEWLVSEGTARDSAEEFAKYGWAPSGAIVHGRWFDNYDALTALGPNQP